LFSVVAVRVNLSKCKLSEHFLEAKVTVIYFVINKAFFITSEGPEGKLWGWSEIQFILGEKEHFIVRMFPGIARSSF
jgi:hypothetical protein